MEKARNILSAEFVYIKFWWRHAKSLETSVVSFVMIPSHHSIYVLIESVRIYVLIDVYVNLGSLAGGGSTVNHQGQLNIWEDL